MTLSIRRIGRDEKPPLNLLLYGMAGVGKTTLAAQAQSHPELSPVLVADLEGGLLSVASRGDIDAVEIRSTDDLEELYWELRNGLTNADGVPYKTVIIDSGTNLANRALEEWVGRNTDRQRKKGRGDKDRTLDDVQLEDYGKMGIQVRRIISWYRDLPHNLIVTALARFEFASGADSKTAEPVSVGPDFTAKLQMTVTGLMDHVWYLYVDEAGRHMLTREAGVYRAKTRGQHFNESLGFIVDDPDLTTIYDLLVETESAADATEAIDEVYPEPSEDPAEDPETVEQSEYEPAEDDDEIVLPDDYETTPDSDVDLSKLEY